MCFSDKGMFGTGSGSSSSFRMLFRPWSRKEQTALIQIRSWMQWKFLEKASLFLQGGRAALHSITAVCSVTNAKKSRDQCPPKALSAQSPKTGRADTQAFGSAT